MHFITKEMYCKLYLKFNTLQKIIFVTTSGYITACTCISVLSVTYAGTFLQSHGFLLPSQLDENCYIQLDKQRLGGRNSFRRYNYVDSLGLRPILMSYEVKGLKQGEQSLIAMGLESQTIVIIIGLPATS